VTKLTTGERQIARRSSIGRAPNLTTAGSARADSRQDVTDSTKGPRGTGAVMPRAPMFSFSSRVLATHAQLAGAGSGASPRLRTRIRPFML